MNEAVAERNGDYARPRRKEALKVENILQDRERRQRGRGEKSDGFDECNANYKTRNVSLQGFSSFHHTFLFFIACYGTSRFRDVTFAFSDMETHAG